MKIRFTVFPTKMSFCFDKPILIFLFVFVSVCSLLNSVTYHIKQDGTGNFTTIQAGIIASSNTDTVLVYPGIYLENVDYLEKSITLASLYLTTGNEDYVDQTIIDGNQSGSCVEIRNCNEAYNTLCGFTLRNGTGNQQSPTAYGIVGGGVLIYDSHININNCDVYNNKSEYGGGIFCKNSTIQLSGVLISNNRSYKRGGGIFLFDNSEILFCNDYLCNIYLNYGSWSGEICKTSDCPPLEVIVDTFTVMDPDGYFISSYDAFGNPLNDITLSIQNAKIEPIDVDLYVATDGDNANSGLTAEEPLATINYAYSLIQPDSLENNTIYVADGEYSTLLNDQWFPLQMRGYVNLIGESMDNTIFDAEFTSPLITDKISEINYTIKNLTLINGYGVSGEGTGTPWSTICISDSQLRDKWVILENIKSYNCEANSRDIALWFISAYLKNVHVYDNLGNASVIQSLSTFQNEIPYITVEIENCSVKNCDTNGFTFLQGFYSEELSQITLKNVEITDNYNTDTGFSHAFSAIVIEDKKKVDMINCTIGYNRSEMTGGAIGCIGKGSELNIYNSIVYENDPKNMWIGNDYEDDPFIVNIHNSLFDHGVLSITNDFSWNIVNWLEGNLEGDPLWQENGDYPYMLTQNSPCINAGTLDLPPGIELPEFDLAGNPRIYGETIDMGAYEFQGDPQSNDENVINIPEINQISNYPNPFNPSTTIKLDLAESGEIELVIYNIKGQKVKTLMDAYSTQGHFEIIWRGIDDNKKKVASGQYIIKLRINGNQKSVKRMLLLK
ncbi:MAG: T9SS type A sorting domain-containing protein [FCB group bacterium]|nr:T9SS type A sorting domain-containing protein [FCB group bacterium]